MKDHVKQVLSLWKASSGEPSKVSPFQMPQQFKNMAAMFSPGHFYYYILDFPNVKLEFINEGTRDLLALEPEEVTVEKLIEVLVPEERESMGKKESVVVDFILNFLDPKDIPFYKIVYFARIQDFKGKYHDILHQATVLSLTKEKKPKHVMVVHTDVSHLNFIKKDTVSFIHINGGESYFDVAIENGRFNHNHVTFEDELLKENLSRREKEIIQLLAEGKCADEISESLNLSVHTIRTHRKNILKKSGCKNSTEVVAKCLLEGII